MDGITPVAKSPFPYVSTESLKILPDNELGEIIWALDSPSPIEKNCTYMRVGCIGDGSCFFHAITKALSEPYRYSYRVYSPTGLNHNFLNTYDSYISKCRSCPIHYYGREITQSSLAFSMAQFRGHYARSFRLELADSILRDNIVRDNIRKYMKGSIELEADRLRYHWKDNSPMRNSISDDEAIDRGYRNLTKHLVEDLRSMKEVRPDYILLLSDILGVDIYVIRDKDLSDTTGRVQLVYSQSLHMCVRGNRDSIVIIAIGDMHYEIISKYDHSTSMREYVFKPSEPIIKKLYSCIRCL